MYSPSTWMTLRAGPGGVVLQEHLRAYAQLENVLSPDEKSPQLIVVIGTNTKTYFMKKLAFGNFERDAVKGEVHLRVDHDGLKEGCPRIFADCELHSVPTITSDKTENSTGDIARRPLTWSKDSQILQAPVAHLVYSRLIAPFSTIICFFADDFRGLAEIAGILAIWLLRFNDRSSDLPAAACPRILILSRDINPADFNEDEATKQFMQEFRTQVDAKHGILTESRGKMRKGDSERLLSLQFSGIRVIATPGLDSVGGLWEKVKHRILKESNEMQAKRQEHFVAFSSRHFKSFFYQASDHFCSPIASPFRFLHASRIHNPIPTEFQSHMAAFLKSVKSDQILKFAVPVIASALVFDSYPAGMHRFNPSQVFNHFFYETCLQIDPFKDAYQRDDVTSSNLARAIEIAFCKYATEIVNTGEDEISFHRKVLLRFKDIWGVTYSNRRCFSCFARRPENTLQCHHSLCEPCVMAYGEDNAEPWTFRLQKCPLCGKPNERNFEHKPPTAGVRALIVEGGGVRGIIPLLILQELEAMVNLPMRIQEHFDIVLGKSSGAINTLALYSNEWSVNECLKQFQDISRDAFGRRRRNFGFSLASLRRPGQTLEAMLSHLGDSKYSSTGITQALITAFGDRSLLFEASARGTKVGVVATTEDSSTCLFTNYNGPEIRSPRCGYNLVRPEDSSKELLVWQAALASSATPPYFKPFQGYYDAGLGDYNNLIDLALSEQDAIWSRQKKPPDIVVSLGIGLNKNNDPWIRGTKQRTIPQARFIPRLFHSFSNSLVDESGNQEVQSNLEPQARERHHRLDFEFSGDGLHLDNIQAMPALREQIKSVAVSNEAIRRCADNVIASLFYLELREYRPFFDGTEYTCKGQIRCRLKPSSAALQVLITRLKESKAYFYSNFEHKLPCWYSELLSEVIEQGTPYQRNIEFKITSFDEFIDITLDGITHRPMSISNCPYKIETLVKDQGLDLPFGSRLRVRRTQSQPA